MGWSEADPETDAERSGHGRGDARRHVHRRRVLRRIRPDGRLGKILRAADHVIGVQRPAGVLRAERGLGPVRLRAPGPVIVGEDQVEPSPLAGADGEAVDTVRLREKRHRAGRRREQDCHEARERRDGVPKLALSISSHPNQPP